METEREGLLAELARESRQYNGLSASLFRTMAGRAGMNATDLQVVDLLGVTGPATAGWLAEVTGLTTGAVTQMLDRLEKAGLVRRERDPEDARRVVVRLIPDEDATRAIGPIFDSVAGRWDELLSRYDDAQLALLVEFFKRANAASREEIARLREAPAAVESGDFSAPLDDLTNARLVVAAGTSGVTVRADAGLSGLYRAHFEGPAPGVTSAGGTVIIRYPRRWWLPGRHNRAAEIALSTAVTWRIEIQGGASEIIAELSGLALGGLEIKSGLSEIRVALPTPSGTVPVRITGGASAVSLRRPAGIPARVRLKGWAAHLTFDDQIFTEVGNDARLQSPGYEGAVGRYDVEVSGSASAVTLTAE